MLPRPLQFQLIDSFEYEVHKLFYFKLFFIFITETKLEQLLTLIFCSDFLPLTHLIPCFEITIFGVMFRSGMDTKELISFF